MLQAASAGIAPAAQKLPQDSIPAITGVIAWAQSVHAGLHDLSAMHSGPCCCVTNQAFHVPPLWLSVLICVSLSQILFPAASQLYWDGQDVMQSLVGSYAEGNAAGESGAGSASTTAAYLSKMQMLRELGFLPESPPAAEAQPESQQQAADALSERNIPAESAELASSRPGEVLDLPQEAVNGMPAAQQGLMPGSGLAKGRPGHESDEQRCCHAGSIWLVEYLYFVLLHEQHLVAADC